MMAGAVMTAALVALLSLYRLPGIYYLLYLLASIPLAAAQYMLNRFWSTCERPGLLVRQAFSVSELIAIDFWKPLPRTCRHRNSYTTLDLTAPYNQASA